MGIFPRFRAFSAPMWASPLAPPPPRGRPMFFPLCLVVFFIHLRQACLPLAWLVCPPLAGKPQAGYSVPLSGTAERNGETTAPQLVRAKARRTSTPLCSRYPSACCGELHRLSGPFRRPFLQTTHRVKGLSSSSVHHHPTSFPPRLRGSYCEMGGRTNENHRRLPHRFMGWFSAKGYNSASIPPEEADIV
jgi:hypothetical protein